MMTYKMIEKPENITEETIRLARTLGWCTEIVRPNFYLVTLLDNITLTDVRISQQIKQGRFETVEFIGISFFTYIDPVVILWIQQLQAYCIVLDDIADESITRRGMPCWYRREDVGLANAVNDATLIHYCMLRILRANFEKSPNYVNMYHNINEVCFACTV